jgi:N,N-dimethylformamidase
MAEQKIFGYADKISVRLGDDIGFFVHADGTTSVEAQLVRLVHGDIHPAGPGYKEEEIANPQNGSWTVCKQFTQVGSFLTVDDPEGHLAPKGSFTLAAFVYPNKPGGGERQCLMGRWDAYNNRGYGLWINPAGLLEDLGRPPQKLLGVGFISEGFDSARPYRRMPDSWHRRADWMFEGIKGENPR